MPHELEAGVLYVSQEFDVAVHLCACGCGVKIRTPLGPTEWKVVKTPRGLSLSPSVGNWQQPCQSHYWITRGDVSWSDKWTPEQIAAGREHEEQCRRDYYEAMYAKRPTLFKRFWLWIKSLFSQ